MPQSYKTSPRDIFNKSIVCILALYTLHVDIGYDCTRLKMKATFSALGRLAVTTNKLETSIFPFSFQLVTEPTSKFHLLLNELPTLATLLRDLT